ncbi:MAG: C-GCAxxG-C-C family (seleno)protein [Eubacteriales bacterium]|nr:C-GCAxxG-C-C family (seleno)protein [Eubacteriales bacterium]
MNEKSEKIYYLNHNIREYKKEGYPCGPASLKALAETYGVSLCLELEYQGLIFTNGGYVKDRCAFFQSAAVIIGLWLGRTDPSVKRDAYRQAMGILSETFSKNVGSYLCQNISECSDFQNEECLESLSQTVIESLDYILENIVRRQSTN